LVHDEVLTPGWQLWQELLGLRAPDATTLPVLASPVPEAMSHWVPHAPAAQTSPLPHVNPSAWFVQAVALDVGVHIWQLLFGFDVPAANTCPPMKQLDEQAPALQYSPAPPHDVPAAVLLQALVPSPGEQTWHALAGLAVPDGYTIPAMKHCAPQEPPTHASPAPHDCPSAAFVQTLLFATSQVWHGSAGFACPGV
jgi:hypothetical protein